MKKKNRIWIFSLMCMGLALLLSNGCKKDKKNNTTIAQNCGFNSNLTYGSVKDIDGNTYKTIKIGIQTWTAENLKTTKYNDGNPIPLVENNEIWDNLHTGARCYYNNDSLTFKNTYGALYNWYTVNTDKLCPTGWHVPSNTEWNQMEKYLDSSVDTTKMGELGIFIGLKLKESDTTHWNSPNKESNNCSGFLAIPAGCRGGGGSFLNIGKTAFFWTATDEIGGYAWYRGLSYDKSTLFSFNGYYNGSGSSIRCLQNVK